MLLKWLELVADDFLAPLLHYLHCLYTQKRYPDLVSPRFPVKLFEIFFMHSLFPLCLEDYTQATYNQMHTDRHMDAKSNTYTSLPS